MITLEELRSLKAGDYFYIEDYDMWGSKFFARVVMREEDRVFFRGASGRRTSSFWIHNMCIVVRKDMKKLSPLRGILGHWGFYTRKPKEIRNEEGR